ncbi:cache domain-containing sensor histidine kinase [Cohnella nanjingensis]|uniref:histidine kinase n=1 Tax=Cohnella nanjingensis TaxID=1387779 RepID=A0A7X0RQ48_9BACL|nr:sensor histidine kinase [Cohnella nanjingensis]MBB6670219.1 sensor histidine kinase [Cohnella nanjingensis]
MKILNIFSDRNFNVKLKTQLIASFLTMTLLIVSVISLLVYHSVMSILKTQSKEMVTRQFRQSEYNILNFRDQLEKMTGMLAINKDVQSFIGQSDAPDEATRLSEAQVVIKSLDKILSTYPYVDSISLYRRNGEALFDSGSGSWYREDARDVSPFYSSAVYDRIVRQGNGFLWDGQMDSTQFRLADRAYPDERAVPYVTVVRNVYLLGRVNQSAVIAVNVKQSEFGSIFNGDSGDVKNVQYLINADGIRISQSDSGEIGSRAELADRIDPAMTNGSFAIRSGDQTKQITYYRIGGTGWTLISEMPEAEFIRNILALRQLILVAGAVGGVLALLLSAYWIYRITKPFNHLVHAMREMEKGHLGVMLDETPSTELGIIGRRFNKMSQSIEELIEENKAIEKDKRKLEMEALQSQINPHFLYNALNTIKWIAMVRKELSIVDSITTLGNMLRTIYKDRSLTVPLQTELAYIENYLKIMNARYGEGVEVSIRVPEELRDCRIIRFILQPIVENAFIHGMTSKSYQGTISITARRDGDDLIVAIADNGTGIPEKRLALLRESLLASAVGSAPPSLPGGSIGLANVNRRIRMQYGKGYGLAIESRAGSGTEVSVRVPAIAASKEKEGASGNGGDYRE